METEVTRNHPLEQLDEQYHKRLSWLEAEMERLAAYLFRSGREEAAFGMPFYDVQDKLAYLIGLPDDYWEYMELEMDPRTVLD